MNTIDNLAINSIRILSADAIQKANSGHPGLPLGSAPMAYELWAHHMNHNPANPEWANRDRFILSGGHGSMLLYSLLHLFGYGLTKDQAVATLSGGEQARVKLCLLTLRPCNFLLLDEPTNHLDRAAKEALARALDRFPGTVLLVSHEADFYRAWAQRVVEIGGKGR